MRKTKFQNEYYYHIYNRGVDKREFFCDEKDYLRFLRSMREFNSIKPIGSLYRQNQLKRLAHEDTEDTECLRRHSVSSVSLVEIIAYCLNQNHYHLILKQKVDYGISKFMHKLGMAYSKYFNEKYNRSGSLFQGSYKSVPIKTDSQLLYVSAYINGNPEIHKIAKYNKWQYSSCLDYSGKRKGNLCSKKVILDQFENITEYKEYIKSVVKDSSEIKEEVKESLLE